MREARRAALLRTLARALSDEAISRACPEAAPLEVRAALQDAADALAPAPGPKAEKAAPKPPRPSAPAGLPTSIIAYTDGASRGNPGPAGAGALLTDADGAPLAELREHVGRATNNVAEYRALLLALREAAALGVRRLLVRADSELLVRQMTGVYKVRDAGLKALADEARRLSAAFERVDYEHVRRERNQEADRLANEAIDRAGRR